MTGWHMFRFAFRSLSLLMLPILLTACQPYALRGVVVQGNAPAIQVVDASDSRLQQPGLSEVNLELTIDPEHLANRPTQTAYTDSAGQFAMAIDETGAGFLRYNMQLVARRKGFQASYATMPLPTGDKRLLIIMTPGKDSYQSSGDLLRDTIRFKE